MREFGGMGYVSRFNSKQKSVPEQKIASYNFDIVGFSRALERFSVLTLTFGAKVPRIARLLVITLTLCSSQEHWKDIQPLPQLLLSG